MTIGGRLIDKKTALRQRWVDGNLVIRLATVWQTVATLWIRGSYRGQVWLHVITSFQVRVLSGYGRPLTFA